MDSLLKREAEELSEDTGTAKDPTEALNLDLSTLEVIKVDSQVNQVCQDSQDREASEVKEDLVARVSKAGDNSKADSVAKEASEHRVALVATDKVMDTVMATVTVKVVVDGNKPK